MSGWVQDRVGRTYYVYRHLDIPVSLFVVVVPFPFLSPFCFPATWVSCGCSFSKCVYNSIFRIARLWQPSRNHPAKSRTVSTIYFFLYPKDLQHSWRLLFLLKGVNLTSGINDLLHSVDSSLMFNFNYSIIPSRREEKRNAITYNHRKYQVRGSMSGFSGGRLEQPSVIWILEDLTGDYHHRLISSNFTTEK